MSFLRLSLTTAVKAVFDVFFLCSGAEVCGVNAFGIVALVENQETVWYRAVVNDE